MIKTPFKSSLFLAIAFALAFDVVCQKAEARNATILQEHAQCMQGRTIEADYLSDIAAFVRENKIRLNRSVIIDSVARLRLPCETAVVNLSTGWIELDNSDLYLFDGQRGMQYIFNRHFDQPHQTYGRECRQFSLQSRRSGNMFDCINTTGLPNHLTNIFAGITYKSGNYSADYYNFGNPTRRVRRILSTRLQITKIGYLPSPHGLGKRYNIVLIDGDKTYLMTVRDDIA